MATVSHTDKSGGADAQSALLRKDGQLLQIMDAALVEAASRAGEHLVCRPGCTQCCHGAFAINALDALRLRTAMIAMAAADPVKAQRIQSRARQYLAEFAPSFPGDPRTGILGASPEQQDAFEDFANEAPCPALDPTSGLCDVYEARPMTCRVFGPPVRVDSESAEPAFSVCELCFTKASEEEIAACEMPVPHAEEQALLEIISQLDPPPALAAQEDTIVAYCLLSGPFEATAAP